MWLMLTLIQLCGAESVIYSFVACGTSNHVPIKMICIVLRLLYDSDHENAHEVLVSRYLGIKMAPLIFVAG